MFIKNFLRTIVLSFSLLCSYICLAEDFTANKIMSEKNDAVSQYNLGLDYQKGNGVDKDFTKAKYCFERAIENGSIDAFNSLGDLYFYGKGVSINKIKAFELYKEGALKGNLYSNLKLAFCYYYGDGVEESDFLAYHHVQLFLNNDSSCSNMEANFLAGNLLSSSQDISQDYNLAFKYFEKARSLGSVEAIYKLGSMYLNGTAPEHNLEKAALLFMEGSERNNGDSINALALCYAGGVGVEENDDKAQKLLSKACKLGDDDACRNIDDYQFAKEQMMILKKLYSR